MQVLFGKAAVGVVSVIGLFFGCFTGIVAGYSGIHVYAGTRCERFARLLPALAEHVGALPVDGVEHGCQVNG